MGGDGAVGGGVGDAGQDEAVALLGVIEERLVGLVNGSLLDLAGAAGAGTSAARVGQIEAGLLGESIPNVRSDPWVIKNVYASIN